MSLLARLADRIINRPLMILPEKLAIAVMAIDGRIGLDARDLAPLANKGGTDLRIKPKAFDTTGPGIAIVRVLGSLVNRGGFLDAMSGVTSYDTIRRQLNAAAFDPEITTILLDIDSPGGEAGGAMELAGIVRLAAQRKPTIAVVNGLCCSAAFAIASGATRIVCTPSSLIGSIGVVMLHTDNSARLEKAGIVPTLIYAGAHKVDGNPLEKLSDQARESIGTEIEKIYAMLIECVAFGRRNLSPEAIRATEAKTYLGADAVAVGLADEIGSFDGIVNKLAKLHPTTMIAGPKREMFSQITQADLDAARRDGARAMAAEMSRPRA